MYPQQIYHTITVHHIVFIFEDLYTSGTFIILRCYNLGMSSLYNYYYVLYIQKVICIIHTHTHTLTHTHTHTHIPTPYTHTRTYIHLVKVLKVMPWYGCLMFRKKLLAALNKYSAKPLSSIVD